MCVKPSKTTFKDYVRVEKSRTRRRVRKLLKRYYHSLKFHQWAIEENFIMHINERDFLNDHLSKQLIQEKLKSSNLQLKLNSLLLSRNK